MGAAGRGGMLGKSVTRAPAIGVFAPSATMRPAIRPVAAGVGVAAAWRASNGKAEQPQPAFRFLRDFLPLDADRACVVQSVYIAGPAHRFDGRDRSSDRSVVGRPEGRPLRYGDGRAGESRRVHRAPARLRRLLEAVAEREQPRLAERGPEERQSDRQTSPVNPAGTIRSGKPVRFAMLVADGVPPPPLRRRRDQRRPARRCRIDDRIELVRRRRRPRPRCAPSAARNRAPTCTR